MSEKILEHIRFLPFKLYADETIGIESDRVAFNAGSLNHSVIMAASDWMTIAKPNFFDFGQK